MYVRPSVCSIVCGVDGRGDYVAHIEVRWRSRKKGIILRRSNKGWKRWQQRGRDRRQRRKHTVGQLSEREREGGSEVDGESGERSPMRRWTCFPSRRRGRSLSTGFVPARVSGVLGSMKDSWRWKGSPVVWSDSLMGTLVGEENTGRSWTGAHPADWQIYSTLRKVRVLKEAWKDLEEMICYKLVFGVCCCILVLQWFSFPVKAV